MSGKIAVILLCVNFVIISCVSIKHAGNNAPNAPIVVEAKKWSRVDGKITHSDWTKFNAVTLNNLPDFDPVSKQSFGRYGGDTDFKTTAKG